MVTPISCFCNQAIYKHTFIRGGSPCLRRFDSLLDMSGPYQLTSDGKCKSCITDVEDHEILKCFRCKFNFHALCKGSTALCNKSLLVLFHQKSTKKNFVWFCDICLTELEINETESMASHTQKVNDLENKIDLLSAQVTSITDILSPDSQSGLLNRPGAVSTVQSGNATNNVWQNTSKVLIMKNNIESPNLEQLEKRIVGEQIQVSNSKRNTNGDVVITCPTSVAANKVKELAAELLPDHTVKDPYVKYSWVNVVGFEINHSPDTVYDLLVKNNFIFESLKGKTPSEARDFLEVKAVKPCAKNPNVFRALLKVSTALREVIKRGNDKLRIGLYSCRVYDQAPQVKRCNKCQRFGHWVASCSVNNGVACAKCGSENHESRNCPNPDNKKCINCIRAGVVNIHPPHTADSPSCPCFNNYRTSSYSSTIQATSNLMVNKSDGQQILTQTASGNRSRTGASQLLYPGNYQSNSTFSNYGVPLQTHAPVPQMASNQYSSGETQFFTAHYPPRYMQPNSQAASLNH